MKRRVLFVTGTLAAPSLEALLPRLEGIEGRMAVLPVTVAALMTASWVDRHLEPREDCDEILLPGLLRGDLEPLERRLGCPVRRGPKDLKDLPRFFGGEEEPVDYEGYSLKIVAEIVEAWRLCPPERLEAARAFRAAGADIIDLGGPPGGPFPAVAEAVRSLKAEGFAVSVDSLHGPTLEEAARAGADLLLSVNGETLHLAQDWPCPVVVIPDGDGDLDSLYRNLDSALERKMNVVADPLLSPLLFGFARSLAGYVEVRRRYPQVPMLMGGGNVTELVEADSVGINALLAGVAEELSIGYVLTTEVVSWTAGTVRELDRARKMMRWAGKRRRLAKHMRGDLVVAKELPFDGYDEKELRSLAAKVRDANFRIFVADGKIVVFNGERFICAEDPAEIFGRLGHVDASHAFYLGRELERAHTAALLGKKYVQESPLRWGYRGEGR